MNLKTNIVYYFLIFALILNKNRTGVAKSDVFLCLSVENFGKGIEIDIHILVPS